MNDLNTLHSAFGELERQADTATASRPFRIPAPRRPARSRLLVPVAATIAVAGMATGAVVLTQNGGESTAPNSITGASAPSSTSTATDTAPKRTEPITFPMTADELAERFRRVLGDTVTFEISYEEDGTGSPESPQPTGPDAIEPDKKTSDATLAPPGPTGAYIVGTLTASGQSGGFDLQIQPSEGPRADPCAPIAHRNSCDPFTRDDGSVGYVSEMDLQAGGVTYEVELTTVDGYYILMHISTRSDPKGAGENLSPEPPLTKNQLVEIVTSDRW